MKYHHFNLFEKSSLTGYDQYLFHFKHPSLSGQTVSLLWNKDKSFDCLKIKWWKIQGLQNEEQIWKVLDAYVNFYDETGLPRDDFKSKRLRKNCKFYKDTFGDLKLTITGK